MVFVCSGIKETWKNQKVVSLKRIVNKALLHPFIHQTIILLRTPPPRVIPPLHFPPVLILVAVLPQTERVDKTIWASSFNENSTLCHSFSMKSKRKFQKISFMKIMKDSQRHSLLLLPLFPTPHTATLMRMVKRPNVPCVINWDSYNSYYLLSTY
ncbi:hypothetical protein AVEN_256279-1 [Araneus ventricosus]|uniref:Uncharacterized protein n=1 Tax=Araneus ventricosus TaxID=182803 RepID=A0A4Y2C560_ARAVE|nr:hypothetical protein AVEN_256279-1 [Araneus ventricosus]